MCIHDDLIVGSPSKSGASKVAPLLDGLPAIKVVMNTKMNYIYDSVNTRQVVVNSIKF